MEIDQADDHRLPTSGAWKRFTLGGNMATLKQKLEDLKKAAADFARAVKYRKSIAAFIYKTSNQPVTPGGTSLGNPASVVGTINQRNVVAIDELCNHVLTAEKLGYITQLQAGNGELTVYFVEKIPPTPIALY
jgi:hypothetical protein